MTNNTLIQLRMPLALQQHAAQVAKAQGLNLSSFTRQAIIRNVELYTRGSQLPQK